MYKRLIVLLVLSGISEAQALQVHQVDNEERIIVKVAKDELNRLTFTEDRIKDIFTLSGKLDIAMDDTGGQVFIKPIQAQTDKIIGLTVITERGVTQDLGLMPADISSETIILRPELQFKVQENSPDAFDPSVLENNLIKAMVAGDEVRGYSLARNEQEIAVWRDIEVKQSLVYRGQMMQGIVYQITNKTGKEIVLAEQQLAFDDKTVAVALENNILAPNQTIKGYVVRYV